MSGKYSYLKPLDLESVEFAACINPAKMTKRIKTSVKKMLLGGYCVGGENAEAKTLAQRILETYDIPHIRSNGRSVVHVLPKYLLIPTAKERLEELIGACDVARKLEGTDYFRDELPAFRERLKALVDLKYKTKTVYCWMHQDGYAEEALSLFKEHNANNKDVSHITKHLIALIDNDTLIGIKLGKPYETDY
jgi:hypothetical protein